MTTTRTLVDLERDCPALMEKIGNDLQSEEVWELLEFLDKYEPPDDPRVNGLQKMTEEKSNQIECYESVVHRMSKDINALDAIVDNLKGKLKEAVDLQEE